MDKRFYDSLERIRRKKATKGRVQLAEIKTAVKKIRYNVNASNNSKGEH